MRPNNTNTAKTGSKAFSIANFQKAFESSPARKYMSQMEVAQVRSAIEEKNIMLLGQLYDVLLREQVADEQIVRDFVMTKNRVADNFAVEVIDIEKKMVQGPMKQKAAKAEKKEQKGAEDLLKNL